MVSSLNFRTHETNKNILGCWS